jgi:hypothetical protein
MTLNIRRRIALPGALLLAALVAGIALNALRAKPSPGDAVPQTDTNGAISPKDEADSLHFVIAADREMLCRVYLAHRPADADARGGPGASGPCPSVALRAACESIQSQGAEFSYALRALAPLGQRNGPQTDLEQAGLAFIASHPGQNYYGNEMLGGRRYFTAVYPDLPAAAACVDCHNRTSGAAARPHRAGDALGGVVVRVPLEF